MKKLVFATALALGSLTAISATTPIFHDGIMEIVIAQDFTEIAVEDVPQAIVDALGTDHPGATIDKAHVNGEAQYKLEVTKEDGTTAELYADAEGNWLDM
ncbi:hypothetical protein [Costertonia aggregata]|uniref:PepSY domain-containing protein n=1 Tax=Costertonia aggregata TaxID=343403 RepID=A0A7H9AQE8_9FLAO|nr:hypothetical protein [Costertonia aggregata]QLG45637.1 hypothetical protein HYG79_09850 [Costertonia aggregata]